MTSVINRRFQGHDTDTTYKGDSGNHRLDDPYVCVVFRAFKRMFDCGMTAMRRSPCPTKRRPPHDEHNFRQKKRSEDNGPCSSDSDALSVVTVVTGTLSPGYFLHSEVCEGPALWLYALLYLLLLRLRLHEAGLLG